VIGDVLEDEGAAVADELGDGARFAALDVTDEGSWRAAATLAEDAFGPISVLVNIIVCDATYSTGSEFCVDGGILAGISVGD
jgi:3alpha(or 20beta)-hydroxysteroid dehydrogenase